MKDQIENLNGITRFEFRLCKANKFDNQYLVTHDLPQNTFITERIKIEAYQGYSNAYNLGEYFRLRGATSWKSGEQVTGLFKTAYANTFYGDRVSGKAKTLILFRYHDCKDGLTVLVFREGYRPSSAEINKIIPTVL